MEMVTVNGMNKQLTAIVERDGDGYVALCEYSLTSAIRQGRIVTEDLVRILGKKLADTASILSRP